MNNLNKFEVFEECGFGSHNFLTMPALMYEGYDKVMDYCYTVGRKECDVHIVEEIKNLNKDEVFRKCGFDTSSMYPFIRGNLYDKLIKYLFRLGFEAGINTDVKDTYKKCKDLEAANARLLQRNHELQVDNEESLKEVENQYNNILALNKIIEDLRNTNGDLARTAIKQDIESVPKSKFVITVKEF